MVQTTANLGQGFGILPFEPDLLPHLGRSVRPLNSFDVEVAASRFLLDRGISAVCQGATAAVAEPRDIVLVAAESLCATSSALCAGLVATEAMIDHLNQAQSLTFARQLLCSSARAWSSDNLGATHILGIRLDEVSKSGKRSIASMQLRPWWRNSDSD